MCQKVKTKKQTQINYNWLYIIVHIIIKKSTATVTHWETKSLLTLPTRRREIAVIILSLSLKRQLLSKQSHKNKAKLFFHAYEKKSIESYHIITIIGAKETLNMHALDTVYLYDA